jgi:hypothetical protein
VHGIHENPQSVPKHQVRRKFQSANKESTLSSIPEHRTEQSCPAETKKSVKRKRKRHCSPRYSPTHLKVSRPQSQLTAPGVSLDTVTQNVPPPPLHLHNLRPLRPLPQAHHRMPARLNRTRPAPLHRLRHRLTPLPKLEARETVPAMSSPAGSTDEPNRSRANYQIRRREVAGFLRHAGSWERFLGPQGG